jgi:hypothetical protein
MYCCLIIVTATMLYAFYQPYYMYSLSDIS